MTRARSWCGAILIAVVPWMSVAEAQPAAGDPVVRSYIDAFHVASEEILTAARRSDAPSRLITFGDSVIRQLREHYGVLLARVRNGEKADKSYDSRRLLQDFGGRELQLVDGFTSFASNVEQHIRTNHPTRLERFGLSADDVWPSYAAWRTLNTALARQELGTRTERYRIRYSGGEVLNTWLEVPLDNLFIRKGWFGASPTTPSRAEPIARFSPLLYSSATKNMISVAELGLNFYAFGGLLTKINPIGAAVTYGDPTQERLGKFSFGRFRPGAIVHVRRLEVGWTRDHEGRDHLLTTFNFHVLPKNWF